MYMRKVRDFALVGMSLQDGAQEEQHSKTQQESAWLFRLWYTFDYKYPFYARLHPTGHSVYHCFSCCRVTEVSQQLRLHSCPSAAIKGPVKCAVIEGWGG